MEEIKILCKVNECKKEIYKEGLCKPHWLYLDLKIWSEKLKNGQHKKPVLNLARPRTKRKR